MNRNDSAHVTEILKLEGVGCQGFGILPRFVAVDSELSIGAKAVYAYFCSLAGAGSCAFPRRDTIISQLRINKDTYYKFYHELLSAGYITAHQEHKGDEKGFSRNIYTIIQNPEKFKKTKLQKVKAKEGYDAVYIQGMTQYGYGIIPRLVMMDPRLDVKAKGIYAYYVAYTGAGQNTQLKRELILQHLNISKNTYYKHMKSLIELNYITTEQKTVDGRFSNTTYILNNNPDMEKVFKKSEKNLDLLCTKFSDTQGIVDDKLNRKKNHNLPCTKSSDTLESVQHTNFSDIKNPDTNKYINNNSINYNLSIPQPLSFKTQEGKKEAVRSMLLDEEGYLREDRKLSYAQAQEVLQAMIPKQDYFILSSQSLHKAEYYELFINAMSEMISSEKEMKSRGTVFCYSHVVKRLNQIRKSSHFPNRDIEMVRFARNFTENFERILYYTEVGDIMTYTKSILWDWLNKYNVQQAIDFEKIKNPPEIGT